MYTYVRGKEFIPSAVYSIPSRAGWEGRACFLGERSAMCSGFWRSPSSVLSAGNYSIVTKTEYGKRTRTHTTLYMYTTSIK